MESPIDRHARSVTSVGLAVLLIVGAALRVAVASAPQFTIDGDEGVTGVMAQRILTGEQRYTYFSGQTYNGALEQYLQAALFALGVPYTALGLRVVQIGLALGTMLTIHAVLRRTVRGPWWPLLGAAIFACGPFWNLWLGTRSYGSYAITQLTVSVGLLAALAAAGFRHDAPRAQTATGRPLMLWSGLFGLCCGLVLWNGLSGFEVLGVAIIWTLPIVLRSFRATGAAVVGVLVGAAPVIRWMIVHHSVPLPGGGGQGTTIQQRFFGLVDTVAPKFLGTTFGTTIPHGAAHFLAGGLTILWVITVVVRRRGIADIITGRMRHREAVDLPLLVLPVALAIYLLSDYTWFTGTPRYIEVLYPVAVVLVTVLAHRVVLMIGSLIRNRTIGDRHGQIARGTGLGSAVALGVITALIGASSMAFPRQPPWNTTDQNIVAADRYLVQSGYRNVYAFYWTATVAQYLGGDLGITVAPWSTGSGKSAAAVATVNAASSFAYMTSTRAGDNHTAAVRTALRGHRVSFHERTFGGVTVFSDLSEPLRPAQLGLP